MDGTNTWVMIQHAQGNNRFYNEVGKETQLTKELLHEC